MARIYFWYGNCSPTLFTKLSTLGKHDSIMTDRGFLISYYLENIGTSLNISVYLKWSWAVKKSRSEKSQAIGSVRI